MKKIYEDPRNCKTYSDVHKVCQRNCESYREGGSHTIYKINGDTVVVPRHNGDVPKGLLNAIIKILIPLVGIILLICIF